MKKVYLETPEAIIKALKEGKVVKSKNVKYKLIDGIICSFHEEYGRKLWTVCNSICEYEKPYIDEPEPLKIEVGKFYRTRNGSKAFVYAKADKGKYNYWAVIVNSIIDENFCCTVDGTYSVGKESKKDLVAPWEE